MLDGWMNAFSTEMNDVDDSTYMKSTRFMFRLDLRLLSVCVCVHARVFMPFLFFSHLPTQAVSEDDRKEDWQEPRDRNWDFGGNWLIWCWVLMPPPPPFAVYCVNTSGSWRKKEKISKQLLFFYIRRPHFVCPRVFVFERFDRTMRLPAIPVSNM